jgi:tellurite resistance protein
MASRFAPAALLRSRPIPLASFTAIMGIVALGLDWRFAARRGTVAASVGESIIALGAIAFVILIARWLGRVKAAPQEIAAEAHVAMTASYFGTFGISIALFAVAALPYSRAAALALWVIAAAGSAIVLIYLLGKWIESGISDFELTPALLLPVVGNAASVYAAGELGVTELGWFSFSFALLCWLSLGPLTMYRLLVVQPRLPRKLAPQLAILVSSPAVLANAWFVLDGGVIDALMKIFALKSLFFGLLTIRMWKIGWGEPFNVAMWGWTFPAAALAGAFERIAARDGSPLNAALAIAALIIATTAVVMCALGAARGWFRVVLRSPSATPSRSAL